MTRISKDTPRVIISDFEKIINQTKVPGSKPQKTVINFRNDKRDGIEREIFKVPIKYLRYRKDNGRIRSDIISYEKDHGKLDESKTETQKIICGFLVKKDPEKTEILRKSIKHEGQDQPAIITCDGFLINGNRRKMVFEDLYGEDPPAYEMMKVVILPSIDDPGGPPTLKEIEQLENRYQLQRDGKSEYTGLDMALSIRRKIEMGITLEEQLRDDPTFVELSRKEFHRVIKEYEGKYLNPLNCADRYLKYLQREGSYNNISSGISDKEGRWQAFIDYSNFYENQLTNERWRIGANISEDEIGNIEDASFKLIRKREVKALRRKLHDIVRDFKKLYIIPAAKKQLLALGSSVDNKIINEDKYDKDGNENTLKEIDNSWSSRYEKTFNYHISNAYSHLDEQRESDTPILLLESALKKLNHYNMNIENIKPEERLKGMQLTEQIRDRADELKSLLWDTVKQK